MADPRLRRQLAEGKFVAAPGVFEMITARIAESIGFDAVYVTGYGTVASHLGLPDAGLATYTDMLSRISRICELSSVPVIADADTGYGGLLNVQHTVRGYERAGVTAIQIEDQEFPKKCGHTPYRRVIPLDDMLRKIEVAAEARTSDDFLIIARTDARTGHGLEEAIRRAEAFGNAGADILFVESPESRDEMAEVCRSLKKPCIANMADGGRTPILPAAELQELGYALAIWPALGFLSMGAAVAHAYTRFKETGSSTHDDVPLYNFQDFSKLMGFQEIWDFEERHKEVAE
ncbi:oxaloacetate decarboxylase [Marinibaculum pumilum]|uniref:Oxaloacetate decarboxylase n=1 Tax=Marinibaculum pumilum TaxID=1766165 RepID=A0ABV7L5Q6_9PROT